jgi:hypothetical protein
LEKSGLLLFFWSFQNAHLYPKKSKIKSEKKSICIAACYSLAFKKCLPAKHQQLTPVILATQED